MLYTQPVDYRIVYIVHYVGLSYMFASWVIDGCHLLSWATELSQRRGLTVFSFRSCHNDEINVGRSLASGTDLEGEKSDEPPPEGTTPSRRAMISFSSPYYLGVKMMTTLLVTITWLAVVNWSTHPEQSKSHHSSAEWVSLGSMAVLLFIEMLLAACVAACVPRVFTNDTYS